MINKGTHGLILPAIICAFLGFSSHACGSDHPRMHQALALLKKVEGNGNTVSPSDIPPISSLSISNEQQRIDWLNEALKLLQAAPEPTVGHHAKAIEFVKSAIDDLTSHDPEHKADDDIRNATEETRAAIVEMGGQLTSAESPKVATPDTTPDASPFGSLTPPTPTPTSTKPRHTAPIINLTSDQTRAVVMIKGDNAEGTGFLVKTPDGPAVVTNIHVISNNPNIRIVTNTGLQITTLSLKGASDRDLAMFAIKDDNYSYLDLAADISHTVQIGDEVVTPGDSEGGEVVLNTGGKVLGIGPERIEFDNPIYHGNSGGPVFHTKSSKVLAVVAMAMKVDVANDLDKTSFESRNSAITNSMRYFGLRLDTVPSWEPYDWKRLQTETLFLDQFHKRNLSLDSYFNTPRNSPGNTSKLYLTDDKFRGALENCLQNSSGGDASQRKDALIELLADLNDLADTDMTAIQDMNNFYSFDQQRAKNEIAYRKALKTELDFIGSDLDRFGSFVRQSK
jgi:S1-C subfamily serine protease